MKLVLHWQVMQSYNKDRVFKDFARSILGYTSMTTISIEFFSTIQELWQASEIGVRPVPQKIKQV